MSFEVSVEMIVPDGPDRTALDSEAKTHISEKDAFASLINAFASLTNINKEFQKAVLNKLSQGEKVNDQIR